VADDGVVVDVVFEGGLLHLELANLGDRAAYDVVCSFEPALVDVEGREVSELLLFRRLPFLAPHRHIRTLLGPASDYLESVAVTVEYSRGDGERQETRLTHELRAFRELAYVV
jgi:hypothetical protein